MNLWLTSDYHMGHKNIILYCGRPFKTIEEQDSYIIARHNERIKKEDQVIFLGDFCFRNTQGGKQGEGLTSRAQYYKDQLNGNITYISGNHDRNNSNKTYIKSLIIKWGGQEFLAVHRPGDCSFRYPINFVGHVHGRYKFKRVFDDICKYRYVDLINVGVDVWKFMPMKIEEILKEYNWWEKSGKK